MTFDPADLSILLGAQPGPDDQSLALQRQLGLLGQLSGDRVLAPVGQGLVGQAQQQAQMAQQVTGARLRAALEARQQRAAEQQAQAALAQRQAEQAAAAQRHERDFAAQEAARKADQDYRGQTLGLKRQELEYQRAAAEADAARRAEEAKGKGRADSAKAATDLRKEFQGLEAYKNAQVIAESFKKIQGTSDTGAGDVSLIYSYMRMVDPGSTVREGEFATAANAGSVPDRVVGIYNRVLKGEKLPPEVRSQFKNEAGNLLRAQAARYTETASPYRRLAEQAGVSPEDVVLDLGFDAMLAPSSAAPAAPAGPRPRRTVGNETREWNGTTWIPVEG